MGGSNCIFLGDFVQKLPKGGDCKAKSQQKGLKVKKMKIEAEPGLAIARMASSSGQNHISL